MILDIPKLTERDMRVLTALRDGQPLHSNWTSTLKRLERLGLTRKVFLGLWALSERGQLIFATPDEKMAQRDRGLMEARERRQRAVKALENAQQWIAQVDAEIAKLEAWKP